MKGNNCNKTLGMFPLIFIVEEKGSIAFLTKSLKKSYLNQGRTLIKMSRHTCSCNRCIFQNRRRI